jgi:hypothetical protein
LYLLLQFWVVRRREGSGGQHPGETPGLRLSLYEYWILGKFEYRRFCASSAVFKNWNLVTENLVIVLNLLYFTFNVKNQLNLQEIPDALCPSMSAAATVKAQILHHVKFERKLTATPKNKERLALLN